MNKKINVYCLEDHKIMRDGIRVMFEQHQDIRLVGDSAIFEDFVKRLDKVSIDILVLDIYLNGANQAALTDGFEICTRLKKINPAVDVVAHSAYDDADRVATIMRAGANGFVSKIAGFAELVKAIKLVSAGRRYICNQTAKRLKNANVFLSDMESPLENKEEFFSKREREVLSLLAKGFSTNEIASELFISKKTVESHRNSLIRKAKVKNSAQLIAYAAMRGFIKR